MIEKRPEQMLLGSGMVSVDGGADIGVRHYVLQPWRHIQITRNSGGTTTESETMQSMTGTIKWLSSDSPGRFAGSTLTLTLEDGRRQSFMVETNSGDVVFTGPCQ